MKKQITIILVLVFFAIAGKAQTNHLFGMQTSMGPSYTDTNNAWGFTMANELDYYPIKNLRVGINFEMQNHYGIRHSFMNYANLGFNVNYNLNLYENIVFLNIGTGIFGRDVRFKTEYLHRDIYLPQYLHKYTFGYTANLNLVIRLTDRIDLIPAGLYLQNDTDGNITWSARTSLIYKF